MVYTRENFSNHDDVERSNLIQGPGSEVELTSKDINTINFDRHVCLQQHMNFHHNDHSNDSVAAEILDSSMLDYNESTSSEFKSQLIVKGPSGFDVDLEPSINKEDPFMSEFQSISEYFEDIFVYPMLSYKRTIIESETGYQYLPTVSLNERKICLLCRTPNPHLVYCTDCCTVRCFLCLTEYIEMMVTKEGHTIIYCPSGLKCFKKISHRLITAFIKPESYTVFSKNKIMAERNPNIKTCPSCGIVTKKKNVKRSRKRKENSKIRCSCGVSWCFTCYSPWHSGMSCKSNQKFSNEYTDKSLKHWAKSYKKGRLNAIRCPKCKIYIELISGCDRVRCTRCETFLCYRCGRMYRDWFLITHKSKYSFLGCKYNLHPNNKFLRVLKRASVTTGLVILSPLIVVVISIGCITLCIHESCMR